MVGKSPEVISMHRVRQRNKAAGGHWFEPATLRFFKSRVGGYGYAGLAGSVYFVSSERGPRGARLYSVRRCDAAGNINTVGEFQAYASRAEADRAAKRAAVYSHDFKATSTHD